MRISPRSWRTIPSKAPMAPNAKFTEQAQPMPIGEGQLWKLTTEGPTAFKIPVPDPLTDQIGLIVMIKAALPPAPPRGGGDPPAAAPPQSAGPATVQLALRLKVQNRQITEAEHVFARIDAPAQIAALQTPRPAFLATVPRAEQTPRGWMFLIANAYYDSLLLGDGELTPFADDCGRRENGMHTAGVGRPALVGPRAGGPGGPPGGGPQLPTGCAEQLTARAMTYIGSIDLRRIWIADEERGLVFAYTMFRHPLDAPNKNYPVLLPNGSISDRTMSFSPFDLEAATSHIQHLCQANYRIQPICTFEPDRGPTPVASLRHIPRRSANPRGVDLEYPIAIPPCRS